MKPDLVLDFSATLQLCRYFPLITRDAHLDYLPSDLELNNWRGLERATPVGTSLVC